VSDKGKRSAPKDYQFSSLHVGVAAKIVHVIQRVHPRSLPVVIESALPRVIKQLQEKAKMAAMHDDREEEETSIQLVIRCEREDKSTKDPGPRLLVVDDRALSIYLEYPEYFGLPPWVDVTGSDSFDQPNGLEMLRLDVAVELDDLDSLDLLMSAEPQVVLAPSAGHKVTLTFADDAAAALFRQRMREVLRAYDKNR
ncbi:MAG: hypothetical protein SGPRY_014587, partial [Prymnesium sp.]